MVISIAIMVRSRALPIQLGVVGWDDDGGSNDDEDSGGISSGSGNDLVVKALTALQVL